MSQKPYWQCLATLDSIFAKGLLQLRSGLPHKYYTAVLCAADAQALALVETEFDANAGARTRLGDCQNVHSFQHEILGGDGPMRTAWRRDLTHGEARAITSVKRPWDCVSHESAVTLDAQSCVILLMPQAALAATSELVTRTNALNLCADTSGEGNTHGASSVFPKPAMVSFLEGQPVRVEERGCIGTPGHYRRIFVTCQVHCETGAAPCRIRRNTGSAQTATLGSKEPFAYLGAWLIAGHGIATRHEHAAFKPTACQTRDDAISQNLT